MGVGSLGLRSGLMCVLLALGGCYEGRDGRNGTPGLGDSGAEDGWGTGGEDAGESHGPGSGNPSGSDGGSGDVPDDEGDPFDPLPAYEPLAEGPLAELSAAIDSAVGNGAQGVMVMDLETEQVLFEKGADTSLVPASNTKMFATAAAMEVLGADHRPTIEVFADSPPDASGKVQGNLYVVAHHDYSWSSAMWTYANFPADRVAKEVLAAGVQSVTGDISFRGEAVYEGASLGSYDAATERSQAASQMFAALTAVGVSYGGTAAVADFSVPDTASRIATWAAPPLSVACLLINVPSHNEYADLLMRHVGHELTGESTYAAGGTEVHEWLASTSTDTSLVSLNDGSGLSKSNRVSARNIIDLMRFMADQPVGLAWRRTMTVAGIRGTLRTRMTGADTLGRVWGKTGTLPSIGVVATSGYLFHRHDNRRYLFSILTNGAGSVAGARAQHDAIVGAFARDFRGLGPAPAAPTLLAARSDEVTTAVELSWTAVEGADGYVVWLSPDGKHFAPEDARLVRETSHRAGNVGFSPVYVRVTALREVPGGPLHSVPSDTYAATATAGPSRILLVDGNDRWQAEPIGENPMREAHDFAVAHAAALGERTFDTVANEALIEGMVELDDYDLVIWILGEESDADRTFDEVEQDIVRTYLEDGAGNLIVSGAELAYDLAAGTPADVAFLNDVLRVQYVGDDANAVLAVGAEGGAGIGWIGFQSPATQVIDYPDQLAPGAGAQNWLSYVGGVGGSAAVGYVGDYGVLVVGFPIESIDDPAEAKALLETAITKFGV